MSQHVSINLRYTGDYSLGDSVALAVRAAFVSPMRVVEGGGARPMLDLAFPLEGSWDTIGVSIEQTDDALVAHVVANTGHAPIDAIRDRLEHMLALDIDGDGFKALAETDHVVAALQQERRGVRPVLFPSPYETAARAIIGHRLHVNQAAALHRRIAEEYGVGVEIADDRTLFAFPAPARLAKFSPINGLADKKVEQLCALGAAASKGWLDTPRLQAMTHDAAMSHLEQLGGVGPFSAELILMRGVGDPDGFPETEMRLHRAMANAYQLGDSLDLSTLHSIAETWRPYRSWVGLLLRNRAA